MALLDQLLRLENFFWAWEKAKAAYSFDKTWYDEISLREFEGDLKANLSRIQHEFLHGRYVMTPAQLVAFPKRGDSEDSTPKTRQMFAFSVRDQVAWIALVNVIGPLLDRQMPSWSYGDRLYRSVWRGSGDPNDNDLPNGPLQIGPYRHTSHHLYRPFKFAWPRYRKHLYLTVNVMAATPQGLDGLSTQDSQILNDELSLTNPRVRVPYLSNGYWNGPHKKVYWAGLDLRKFFPSTPLRLIQECITEELTRVVPGYRGELDSLLESMLRFPLDLDGWTEPEIEHELALSPTERQVFQHLPTGLLVSGFLANVAMLRVDRDVARELRVEDPNATHKLAQFRYVDDHVILATDPDELLNWVTKYEGMLASNNDNWRLNTAKIEPPEIRAFLASRSAGDPTDLLRAEVIARSLDVRFPRPLLSHTLTKISVIASTRFELLDDIGQAQFIQDLEMLLLGDFGPSEVRPDTRASFAASTLSRALPHLRQMTTETWQAVIDRQRCQDRLRAIDKQRQAFRPDCFPGELLSEESELQEKLSRLTRTEQVAKHRLTSSRDKDERRTFELLLNAIARFPDKIRLWQTAVGYCARMGYPGLQELIAFISAEGALKPITQDYVLAVVTHATAVELVRAIRRLSDSSFAPEDRTSAARFIASVSPEMFSASKNARWYGPRAWAHLLVAGFAGATCTSRSMADDLFESEDTVAPMRRAAARFEEDPSLGLTTVGRLLKRAPTFNGKLSDAALWLEDSLNRDSGSPSEVWRKLRYRIGFERGSSAAFHARFPSQLTTAQLLRIAEGTIPALSENDGWFYDSLSDRSEATLQELSRRSKARRTAPANQIRRALKARRSRAHSVTLDEWVSWQRAYPRTGNEVLERLSDPRLSEWTALTIVDRVARMIDRLPLKTRPGLHNSGVLLPRAWLKESSTAPGGMSWSEWRLLVRKSIQLVPMDEAIDDERFMGPGWRTDKSAPKDWPWVRGCGLLLLGLLRKSFTWPGIWNNDYSQNASSRLGRAMIGALPCSSITIAILESTIAQRSRENVLRREEMAVEQLTSDTTFDPPLISTLEELMQWTQRALQTLELNQLDGRQNRARQLIPLNIRQLTRPNWTESDDVEVVE